MNKAAKLRWWVLVNTIGAGVVTACLMGAAQFLWHADVTKISFATWFIFFILTAFIGNLTIQQGSPSRDRRQDKRYINACWFASEFLMGLGLIGTVTGIILMFVGANLDPSNTVAMKTTIVTMSSGLTTAFVTTLSGIATSLLTKLQLINYEVNLDDDE